MNSGTDSEITYLVPSTRVITVSGVQSARSTRSGFKANTGPLRRVTSIKASVLGWLGRFVHQACRPIDRPRRVLRSPPVAERAPLPRRTAERTPFASERLTLQIDQVLEQLVGGRDEARVGLEAALSDDQVRELLR